MPNGAPRLLLLALALAAACQPKDGPAADDTGGSSDDVDGDGYAVGQDCDDNDAAVNPGATEVCNGIDDDCDGGIDTDAVDASTWYSDADGDDYGVDATVACTSPVGDTNVGGDCDDTNAAVNPGATEACDGIDENCDGVIDEGVVPTWYYDYDGDGYGDPATTSDACNAPFRYIADGTDCNDANASINPGATEVCDAHETDEDCDGAADDADVAEGRTTWYADTDGDGYGEPGVTLLACHQPDTYVDNDTDCDDADSATWPGAPELCDGQANDCDATAWTASDEDGQVSWTDATGTTSVSAAFGVGTAAAPVAWTAPGDGTLSFCGGTYYTNVVIDSATVTLTGLDGAAVTTLDGGGTGRVVGVTSGGLTLDGLTLTDGYTSGNGAGLGCVSSDLLVENAVVSGNIADTSGGGVALDTCTNAEIHDTTLAENAATTGGGLYAYTSDGLVLDGMDVQSNAADTGGGGLYISQGTFTFTDSTVSDNATSPSYSAGGLLDYYSDGDLDGVTFGGNAASSGAGMEAISATTSIANSTFTANTGGAVYGFSSSTLDFTDTTFSDNVATTQGNVYLFSVVTASFTDCTFTDNMGSTSGVFSLGRSTTATVVRSDFSGNTPYDAYADATGYTLGTNATKTCTDTAGCG